MVCSGDAAVSYFTYIEKMANVLWSRLGSGPVWFRIYDPTIPVGRLPFTCRKTTEPRAQLEQNMSQQLVGVQVVHQLEPFNSTTTDAGNVEMDLPVSGDKPFIER
mmetsp:Transcript_23056/g.34167  ORF Transcript_23056/g.34167 Transcript_23056/m.34167 type:complete len:105 (-) Transcript_23056:701-1015(-)